VNGTNASKNTVVTYGQVGSYTFLVTISDGNKSTTSSVTATVNQKTTTVVVTPGTANLGNGATQLFIASAKDQFGNVMTTQPVFTWTVESAGASAGSVSAGGLYTAPSSGSAQDLVKASATGTLSGTVTGSATVIVSGPVSVFAAESDVGGPAHAGSSAFEDGMYEVTGGGTQIWDPGDQFHFVYKQMTGDATIIARVATMSGNRAYARAGLMFRENLSGTSNHVMLAGTPAQEASLFARYTNGFTATSRESGGFGTPYYLKLVRSGDDFRGYTSNDGISWTLFAATNVTMATTYYVGLAVTANDPTLLNTAFFDHVSVSAGAQESSLVQAMRAESLSLAEPTTEETQMAANENVLSIAAAKVTVNPRLVKGVGSGPMVRVNVATAKKLRKLEVPDVKTR
jgi:hypothetical protein